MPQFVALTSRGLEPFVCQELGALGMSAKVSSERAGRVEWVSTWQSMLEYMSHARLATRILRPVMSFSAYKPDELYTQILKHNFCKYIEPHQGLWVRCKVEASPIGNNIYAAQVIKDAICDQFREQYGHRPDFVRSGILQVLAYFKKNRVEVFVDLSGPLHERGYRRHTVAAPLREHLAAGLLLATDWQPTVPIVDLFCGSGTFLIEAGRKASQLSPQLNPNWPIQKFKTQYADWSKLSRANSRASEFTMTKETMPNGSSLLRKRSKVYLYGFDRDAGCVDAAKKNSEAAQISRDVCFQKGNIESLKNPVPKLKGLLVANPPYGERIGDDLVNLYRQIGSTVRREFPGWTLWLLSGNPELTKYLGLKSSAKIRVWNGSIECRWLKYEIADSQPVENHQKGL